jgi:hypothetical protein
MRSYRFLMLFLKQLTSMRLAPRLSTQVTKLRAASTSDMIAARNLLHPFLTRAALLQLLALNKICKQVFRFAIQLHPFLILLTRGTLVKLDPTIQAISLMALQAVEIIVTRVEEEHVLAVGSWTAGV